MKINKYRLVLAATGLVLVSGTVTTLTNSVIQNSNKVEFIPKGIKRSLRTDLKVFNLGVINNNNVTEISKQVKSKNPKLDLDHVEINILSETLANIVPLDKGYYQPTLIGEVVNFTVKEKLNLNEGILNTYLGKIDNLENETILNKIKELNPDINIDQLEINSNFTSETNTILRTKVDAADYKGEIIVSFELNPQNILNAIDQLDLGFISNYTDEVILNKIVEKNHKLIPSEIEIAEVYIKSNVAKLKPRANSRKYDPSTFAYFTFSVASRSLLDDLAEFIGPTPKKLSTLRNRKEDIASSLVKETEVNINEVNIYGIMNDTFLIQAKEGSKIYRVDKPILIKFEVPIKLALNNMGKMNLVSFRNEKELKIEILSRIKNRMNLKSVSDKDIIIDGFTSANKTHRIKVKAGVGTPYLTGSFTIDLMNLKVDEFSKNQYSTPISSYKEARSQLYNQISKYFTEQKIDEKDLLTKIKNELNKVVSPKVAIQYPLAKFIKSKKTNYYRQITFADNVGQINSWLSGSNKPIIWTNIAAPKYEQADIKLNITSRAIGTWINTWGDSDHYNEAIFYAKSEDTNKMHGNWPRNRWNLSPKLLVTTINYKNLFNFNSATEFFENYKMTLKYKWRANGGSAGLGWKVYNPNWYNISVKDKEKPIYDASQVTNLNLPNSEDYGPEKRAWFDDHIGDASYDGVKAAGAVLMYGEDIAETKEIKVYAVAGTWYYWNDGGQHHYAYSAIKEQNVIIQPK